MRLLAPTGGAAALAFLARGGRWTASPPPRRQRRCDAGAPPRLAGASRNFVAPPLFAARSWLSWPRDDYDRDRDAAAASAAAAATGDAAGRRSRYESDLSDLESAELYGAASALYELDHLANMLRRGRLHLAPRYQRGYVWDVGRASRLVVTALCNRFVPGMVLHEKTKGSFEVVDGKQRLTSLLAFYLYGDDRDLFERMRRDQPSGRLFHRLDKLDESYDSLNGLAFVDLSDERRDALRAYKMTCTVIPHGTPKGDVFSCYEDINSGGMDLKAQQLRRAVFYGPYIELLDRLALDENFQAVRDPRSFRRGTYEPCHRDSDRELILRAFAWSRNYRDYRRPLKTFLNRELQHFEKLREFDGRKHDDTLGALEEEFRFVVRVWRAVFGDADGAFRVWEPQPKKRTRSGGGEEEPEREGSWGKSIHPGLWDAQYSVLADLRRHYPSEVDYVRRQEELRNAVRDLFVSGKLDVSGAVTVPKFIERKNVIYNALRKALSPPSESAPVFSSSSPSSSTAAAAARKTTARTAEGTSSVPPGLRPRKFPDPALLREMLFTRQRGRCSVCGGAVDGNRLHDGTYVHIDHRVPFSGGGDSARVNAGLAHAACNRWKSDRVEEGKAPNPEPEMASASAGTSDVNSPLQISDVPINGDDASLYNRTMHFYTMVP